MQLLAVSSEIRFVTADSICLRVCIWYSLWLLFYLIWAIQFDHWIFISFFCVEVVALSLPIMLCRVQQMDLWEISGSFEFHAFVNLTLPQQGSAGAPSPPERGIPVSVMGSLWFTSTGSQFFWKHVGNFWPHPHTLFHLSRGLQQPVAHQWVFTSKSAFNRASVLTHSYTLTEPRCALIYPIIHSWTVCTCYKED